jgi:ribosome maturation factor RimP
MTLREGNGSGSLAKEVAGVITPTVTALGYDIIDMEYSPKSQQGGAVLRLFIDHLVPQSENIGIEDCVKVDRHVSELLEGPDFNELLPDGFILEVSSPGIDRPLTRPEHFSRFPGKKVRIKTYRPLTETEVDNSAYFQLHPKQKNFGGILLGIEGGHILLQVENQGVKIPFAQVAKAHLDIADDILNSTNFSNDNKKSKTR